MIFPIQKTILIMRYLLALFISHREKEIQDLAQNLMTTSNKYCSVIYHF